MPLLGRVLPLTPQPPLLCSSLPSQKAPGDTPPGGAGCGSRDLRHSAPLMYSSPGPLQVLPGPVQGCTGAAPGSARGWRHPRGHHLESGPSPQVQVPTLWTARCKDTAHCPRTQRPVNEGQRPPSPLEPFDSHSSPLVTVGILFSVLHTPDPRASRPIWLLGPAKASPELSPLPLIPNLLSTPSVS